MNNEVNKQLIYNAVDDCVKDIDLSGSALIQHLFYLVYGEQINYCNLVSKNKITDMWLPNFELNKDEDDDIIDENDENNRLDIKKLHQDLLNLGYYYFPIHYDFYYINKFTDNKSIIYLESDGIEVYTDVENTELYTKLQSLLELKTEDSNKNDVGIMVRNSVGYTIQYMKFNKMDIDVEKTYNDDLPLAAIDNFIMKENTGLCLFYGEAGTGKSTFIKYLIQNYKKDFIILNAEVLYDSTSNSLISEFISNKDAIYIIEDCEKLLVSRDNEQNAIISAFLNMTDGILAEVICCKFICTFNTELTNIDKALLRKGRLKLKYEFKKLDKSKVNKLLPDVNEDMTVAELFNHKKENDFSKKQKKKIGFNV